MKYSTLGKIKTWLEIYRDKKCNCKNGCKPKEKKGKQIIAGCPCISKQQECIPNHCECNCKMPYSVSEFSNKVCKNSSHFYWINSPT